MIGHNITPILYSTYYQSIDQDHNDRAPFMLAVFVTYADSRYSSVIL